MKNVSANRGGDLGFQIAPMIDVVFVIMLFFMVMAGAVKVEFELKIKLPGEDAAVDAPLEVPDELTISITENGQVAINDNEVDKATDTSLPNLFAEVNKLRQNAGFAKTKLLVTVQAEETTRYERIALVLDTLAAARANENVTFAIGDGEG